MYGWFRRMNTHRVVVICGVILLVAYIFGSTGVDISCGPDELMREAMSAAITEREAPFPTPTAEPTATPISNARWALEETMRQMDEVSSFRFTASARGSNLVNEGLAVRPSLSSISVSASEGAAPLAHVRIIGESAYIALPGDEEDRQIDDGGTATAEYSDSTYLDWTRIRSPGLLSKVVHIDPALLLSSAGAFLSEVDSEIIMDGTGETWQLSGLVNPEFVRSMGYSWTTPSGGDYPAQYIIFVSSESFLPERMSFIPYGAGVELNVLMSDYNRPDDRPAIPASVLEVDVAEEDALVSDVVSRASAERARIRAEEEAETADDIKSQSGGLTGEIAPAATESIDDPTFPDRPGQAELWSERRSDRRGWWAYEMPEVGASLELPDTWRLSWSNGAVFMNARGEIGAENVRDIAEGLVGAVSASAPGNVWGWFGWDALTDEPTPSFVLIVAYDYPDARLMSAAQTHRESVISLNPTLVADPDYRTFVSDSGAVCAMAGYDINLMNASGQYRVADCLFIADSGYVGVMVGSTDPRPLCPPLDRARDLSLLASFSSREAAVWPSPV